MLVILKAAEELKEMVYEAKERASLAIELKEEYPSLANTYIEIANSCLSMADKLHSSVVDLINRMKDENTNTTMLEMWKFEHKLYLEKYEKAKMKISMYSKA